jgi:uncharacterized repeat protein (TIGR03837 family)
MQTLLAPIANQPEQTCDIFCQVIDNFGDIGVCWRLARQLAKEHQFAVRLWVDDLASLRRMCPDINLHADLQHYASVEVRLWSKPFPDVIPPNVVIEAFGCELPENYLSAMAQAARKPVWINLEYLSAEPWVESCHARPSPHPRLPLTKYFFFPGFTSATGGLLREQDLFARRNETEHLLASFWQGLNLPVPNHNETVVSLFCYDDAPVGNLLSAWERTEMPVRCLLPEGKVLSSTAAYFGQLTLAPGDTLQRGNLTLHVIPFLRQEDYDQLLWVCDCNFVRGEDSFVRAQWAGKPMVWQIYMQKENAHLVKLDAFLDRYCAGLDDAVAHALRVFHHGWNGDGNLNWNAFQHHRTVLEAHARTWATELSGQLDLASNLVIFCKNRV